MDKEKMIDDIVAMLDGSVKNGDGHINVKIDENQDDSKEVTRGCADCSTNPTACSIPTLELPDDEDFQK
ncbi:MAG: hypothetical protein ACLRZ9_07700 [Eubacterium sp.]